ncbi:NAD-dependent epimerase/dehydratase family protein [Lewinella sp. W8]|uniref:NAD-dependent epimerase/dehydratase family protein n=1 Tax=Lewinella sp. W8 TaxID=2528208 RepID=UPI001C129EE0|nr:NAD-dependent epimerase/dehydratase family protein [Lewinella sp. W8]
MRVILTGATGMIGRAVLLECLASDRVDAILAVTRRPLGESHPKLREALLEDFTRFEELSGAFRDFQPTACFHCMGVSSVGMNEEDYTRLTLGVADSLSATLMEVNPEIVCCYVSGAGSDETESSRTMWARVKGKTENLILNRGFRDAYAFRIGGVIPRKGVKSRTGWVNVLLQIMRPAFSLLSRFSAIIESPQVGQAMINLVEAPHAVKVLDNPVIAEVAERGQEK